MPAAYAKSNARAEADADPLFLLVNSDAEQIVLGSLMIDNRLSAQILGEESFGNGAHGRIWTAIGKLLAQGVQATPVTLKNLFDQDEAPTTVGGAAYLGRLAGAAGPISYALDYAQVVADLHCRRQLIMRCRDAIDDAAKIDFDRPVNEIIACHQGQLAGLTAARSEPFNLIDPTSLLEVPVPDREWIVTDWIPTKRATGLYGSGGQGKTLVAHMLGTACAIGQPWLGLLVRRCRSILMFCEDDDDEMHIRQEAINRLYGCTYADLGDMRWLPRLGESNELMTFEQGRASRTALFAKLLAAAKKFSAKLIVGDTLADIFGGNEVDRGQGRKFVQECLTGLLGRPARRLWRWRILR